MIFVGFLIPILISLKYHRKFFLLLSKTWAIVVIVWSSVRIIISIINNITNTFDENHPTTQFGFFGLGLSLVMLSFGIMIYKYSQLKRIQTSYNRVGGPE